MDEIYKKIYKNEAEKESDRLNYKCLMLKIMKWVKCKKYIVLQPIDIFKQCLTTINIVSL